MNDMMDFPKTVEEFMEMHKMVDTEEVYSNGTEYVPIFRMKQWLEHERTPNASQTHECISREDAMMEARPEYLNPNQKGHEEYNKAWNDAVEAYWNGLKALPSEHVGNSEQLRPKGKWIERNNYAVCSVCEMTSHTVYVMNLNKYIPVKTKFCPHCGALMEEEQVKGEGDE